MHTIAVLSPQGAQACSISPMDADARRRRRVGARIKAARDAKGVSQNALARMIPDESVSGGYVSRWERGENMPSWTNLEAVALALDVTIAWLLENDDEDEA
jgi:transcriptional regulator with XRE-family HTH domain